MKKYSIAFFLCIFNFILVAQAATLQEQLQTSVEQISKTFIEKYPDSKVRQGAVILEFKEESPLAKNKKMGLLVQVYLEEALTNSMVLHIVDRKNLSSIQEEYVLTLTGMVDEATAPEVGYLSGAKVLLFGSIIEEGGDFRISISMTDITSGELMLTRSFAVPNREMIAAAENLQYEYVAKNGIGFSASTFYYLLAGEIFNNSNPVFINIQAKYRLSKSFMLSAGLLFPGSTGGFYRWDPSQDSSQYEVFWSDYQPVLPPALDGPIGQVTNDFSGGILFHLDGQYTVNFSPQFNIGIKLGVVVGPQMETSYKLSSNKGFYAVTTSYDAAGFPTDVITKDYQAITLIFDPVFGGRVELCPEWFITPRLAINGTLGYLLTNKAGVREAFASNGDWGFYDEALESGYNGHADETYFGMDPRMMPDGKLWTLDLSGLYAGLAVSFFF